MAKPQPDDRALFSITLARLRAGLEMRQRDSLTNAQRLKESYVTQAVHLEAMAKAIDQADDEASAMGVRRRRPGNALKARAEALELLGRAQAIGDLEREFKNANFDRRQGSVTPEARVRGPTRATTLYRLFQKGKVREEHLAAAEEIERVYEAIVRPLCVRRRELDGARGYSGTASLGPDYDAISNWLAHVHAKWFKPWCAQLRKDGHLDFVMAVLIDGMAVDAARRLCGMDYKAALKRLIAALDLWGELSNLQRRLHERVGLPGVGAQRGQRQGSATSRTTNS